MNTPQAVYFCTDGVWICDGLDEPYQFNGSADSLVAIMVYHSELDITQTRFYVQEHAFAVDVNPCVRCGSFDPCGCYGDFPGYEG